MQLLRSECRLTPIAGAVYDVCYRSSFVAAQQCPGMWPTIARYLKENDEAGLHHWESRKLANAHPGAVPLSRSHFDWCSEKTRVPTFLNELPSWKPRNWFNTNSKSKSQIKTIINTWAILHMVLVNLYNTFIPLLNRTRQMFYSTKHLNITTKKACLW